MNINTNTNHYASVVINTGASCIFYKHVMNDSRLVRHIMIVTHAIIVCMSQMIIYIRDVYLII